MKTVILAVLMILSATITHAQDNYSLTKEGNSYICKGSKPCKIDERTTFGSAALWAMEKSSNVVENTLKCDPQKLVLSVGCNIAKNENSDKVYTFQLNIAVNKGKIEFLIKDVKCAPKGVLAVFKTMSFDKINLEKKPQYKEYIEKFSVLCNHFIQQTMHEILDSKVELSHWEAIVSGQVVKGMNPKEVILAKGKPLTITENSQRIMWSYDSGTIVMIENGIVSGVIN